MHHADAVRHDYQGVIQGLWANFGANRVHIGQIHINQTRKLAKALAPPQHAVKTVHQADLIGEACQ
jgi:hypothetical protein